MAKVELTWLGQSFFRIISPKGKIILIDPWKDFPPGNKLFPAGFETGEPDLVLVTHGHFDHLGDAARIAKETKSKPNFKIISIFEIMIYLMSEGVSQEKLQGLNKGGSVALEGITVSMVNAVHSSGIGPFAPKNLANGGEAAGFVVALEDGTKIYHAGDTDVFSDMNLIKEIHFPEIALLPIGGVFTMGPKEAAYAAKMLGAKIVIPMHFGGTFGLPGLPEDFQKEISRLMDKPPMVIIPKAGEKIEI